MSYYDWPAILSKYKDEDLLRIIKDSDREPQEKVEAATAEMKKRELWSDDLEEMVQNVRARQSRWDPRLPTLYSKTVIYLFSLFFSVIFGAVLFALNLKTVDKKKGILPVSLFVVALAFFAYYVLSIWNLQGYVYLATNLLGAFVINEVFWRNYIGEKSGYNKRNYQTPLRIGLVYVVLVIVLEYVLGIIPH
jgi:hypothetical protein